MKLKSKRKHIYTSLALVLLLSVGITVAFLRPNDVKAAGGCDINLETATTRFTATGSASATHSETGNTLTVNVTDFGTNDEWEMQYIISDLLSYGLANNKEFRISFDMTSSVTKRVFVRGDSANCFINEWLTLPAGQTVTFTKEFKAFSITSDTLYIGMGKALDEVSPSVPATICLTNVHIEEVDTSNGRQYDFLDTSGDTMDPGCIKTGYTLIWNDEFDGNYAPGANIDSTTHLNLDNWSYELGGGGWGNQELQEYTSTAANIGVNEDLSGNGIADGLLRITSICDDQRTGVNVGGIQYTSARIRTSNGTTPLFSTTYGYVEARMSLPQTQGAWPAFWMLPQNPDIYGTWPLSGEIDIMETVGKGQGGNKVCGTIHYGNPSHVYVGSGYQTLGSDIEYFHTYAVDWEPGKITWYYDGVEVYSCANWEASSDNSSAGYSFDSPFDQPFYLLLNLAVDNGTFGGDANHATFRGSTNMYVDYVRVYQKNEGYDRTPVRTVSSNVKPDWATKTGNQIANVGSGNLITPAGGNVNNLESAGSVDSNKWYLAYQADASDSTIASHNEFGSDWAKITMQRHGAYDYSTQLIGHFNAEAGYVYKVSFDAFTKGRMVGASINSDIKEWVGWNTFGAKTIVLTNTPTTYSYVFEQPVDFHKCRLEFNLGGTNTGEVYIGNVKVEIVDPDTITHSDLAKYPSSSGNLIYNGTFDKGDNRTAYWYVKDGTNLTVPRYETVDVSGHDLAVVDVASKSQYSLELAAKANNGKKYYERRAIISASTSVEPTIFQPDINLKADSYNLKFDLYSQYNTTVTVEVCSATPGAGGYSLGTPVFSKHYGYVTSYGLHTYNIQFETTQDIANAALVLTFQKGVSVRVDNVNLKSISKMQQMQKTPLNDVTSWDSWSDGNGSIGAVVATADGFRVSAITSGTGTDWYRPQVLSGLFALEAGVEYKLSFDYQLTGTHNSTLQYIIQESGGGWHVYAGDGVGEDQPITLTYSGSGFDTVEKTFTADLSLSTVHVIFGFRNSAASNASFEIQNIKIERVTPIVIPPSSYDSELPYWPYSYSNGPSGGGGAGGSSGGSAGGGATGGVSTNDASVDIDLSETIVTKFTKINCEGKKVNVTSTIRKGKDGKVIDETIVSEIKKAAKNTSVTVKVVKDAKGKKKITTTLTTRDTAKVTQSVIRQIKEETGKNVLLTIKVKNKKGKLLFTMKVNTKDIKAKKKLYVYQYKTKSEEYIAYNKKVYQVSKKGTLDVKVKVKATYMLVSNIKAKEVDEQIQKTIKLKKKNVTILLGKKQKIQFSKKLNMKNVREVTYKSSNKKIAKVSKKGYVTAKGIGETKIKIKFLLKNGSTKTITMNVKVE